LTAVKAYFSVAGTGSDCEFISEFAEMDTARMENGKLEKCRSKESGQNV